MLEAESEDLKIKLGQIPVLETQVAELEDKLRLANIKFQEQKKGKLGISRDIGTELLMHAEKKSGNQVSEVRSVPASDTGVSRTVHSTEPFYSSVKFILVIAVVSVLFGVIIGRQS